MATVSEGNLLDQELWTFIKHKRATQSSSLKVLQEFVLSLNKYELRHLIECYLKSKLSSHDFSGTTLKKSFETLITNENNNNENINPMESIDKQILHKMHKKYGKKNNKKIIKQIQQTKMRNNYILSIPPQVLSYSFQYLSFKQLCKIQSVCSYFTYLNSKYNNLSNYFIHLNSKFFIKAMRMQVNLSKLSNFKYVKISCQYGGKSSWDMQYRTKLFKYILDLIFTNHISCIKILEIDIPQARKYGYDRDYRMGILNYIFETYNTLQVNKLIWKMDLNSIDNKFELFIEKLTSKWINVKELDFGSRFAVNSSKYVITPLMSKYKLLQSLNLYCPSLNLFAKEYKIIELIVTNIKNLQKLSITSRIHSTNYIYTNLSEMAKVKNVLLKKLNIKFAIRRNDRTSVTAKIRYILFKLFSTFIGIKHFKFGFIFCHWFYNSVISVHFNIDWQMLFRKLFLSKIIYALEHPNDSLNCLESLEFDPISLKDGMNVLQSLKLLTAYRYFNLKQFNINIVAGYEILHYQFTEFMAQYLLPFIIEYKNKLCLKRLNISYGNRYKCSYGDKEFEFSEARVAVRIEDSYFKEIINLLSNIPKSLISLSLKPPNYQIQKVERNIKIKEIESTKLVKKLCSMLSESNINIQSINLDGISLTSKAKDFLTFMFGYNNNFYEENRKMCLNLRPC